MGKQQSQQGGRAHSGGNRERGEQGLHRPQQGRDLQRNKQSDRGQHEQADVGRGRPSPSGGRQQEQQGAASEMRQRSRGSRQQSQQNVYGEGNYAASRRYNDATKAFAQSGRVEPAARDAEPRSDADAMQMAAAEAEGKRRAKGEDPALNRKASDQPPAPRPGKEEE